MVNLLLIAMAFLFLAVVVLAGLIAMQPAEFRISRSAKIAGAPSDVFAQVNNFHHWQDWSPWAKLDPNAKNRYDGPETGEGAIFQWDGNNDVGAGKMTLIESKPYDLIRIKLEFTRPMTATNTGEFTFEPVGNETNVTWTMVGTNNFVGKAFQLLMNVDKMVGDQFEEGLANLNSVVKNSPQP